MPTGAFTLAEIADKMRAAIAAAESGDYAAAVRLGESVQAMRACVPNTEAGGASLSFSVEGVNGLLEQWRKKATAAAIGADAVSVGLIQQVPMQMMGAGGYEA